MLAEQQSQRADVGVLLVSDVLARHWFGRNVVHHCQCAGRGLVVSVGVLEAVFACEAHGGGETGQDGLGDDVGACNGVLEDLHVSCVLDVAGDVGGFALNLVSGDLEESQQDVCMGAVSTAGKTCLDHFISILCVLEDTCAGTDGLISKMGSNET